MFSANILIVCFLIAYCLKEYSLPYKLILPVVGGWLVLTSPSLIEIHAMAWSESPLHPIRMFRDIFYGEISGGSQRVRSVRLVRLDFISDIDSVRRDCLAYNRRTGTPFILDQKTWLKRISDAILFGSRSLFLSGSGCLGIGWLPGQQRP